MKNKGFTLIELGVAIGILVILAIIAIPQYLNLTQEVKAAATKASIETIRSTVTVQYAQNVIQRSRPLYPATIAGNMFAEGAVPTNQLRPSSNAVVSVYDGSGGWVYHPLTGMVESNDAAHTKM